MIRNQKTLPPTWVYVALVLTAFYLATGVAAAIGVQNDHLQIVLSDILSPLGGLASAAALGWTSWRLRSQSRRMGLAWGFFAAGVLASGIGEVLWSLLELTGKALPFPSIADGFYLMNYLFFLIGAAVFPRRRLRRFEVIKSVLDIATIVLAGVLGILYFVILPLKESLVSEPLLTQIVSLAYPIGDILLFAISIVLIYIHPADSRRRPLLLFSIGLLLYIVADTIFNVQVFNNDYQTGKLVDVGWNLAYMCFAWAGLWASILQRSPQTGEQKYANKCHFHLSAFGENYLPYLWLIIAFAMLVPSHYQAVHLQFEVLATVVGVMIFLIMIRQILSLNDNVRLNTRLNDTMEQLSSQSLQIGRTNRELEKQIQAHLEVQGQLRFAASHDSLTGLPNRAFLLDYLDAAIRKIQPGEPSSACLMFLDCDRFKLVNDSLGHIAGDELLIIIARRIRACLRDSDLIARLGGDEFVIYLPETKDEAGMRRVAGRILESLRQPFLLKNQEVFIGASIGIVKDLDIYQNPVDLLRDADIAMYQAKEAGKSRYAIFEPAQRAEMFDRIALETDLRYALQKNQLELVYQPIVNLRNNSLSGFEALLRWDHPIRGQVPPATFVPIAEQSGLIIPIGQWVLDQAVRQFAEWQRSGLARSETYVSVNISTSQFLDHNFAGQVKAVLDQYLLDSRNLKLEITESVFLSGTESSIRTFNQLEAIGVDCMLDDFGTGYSSLGYLQSFPLKIIKIDRRFVVAIDHETHKNLIGAIMSVAKELGMQTVAEGVDTLSQLDRLRHLKCDLAQGYLFHRPLSAAQVEDVLSIEPSERPRTSASGEWNSLGTAD